MSDLYLPLEWVSVVNAQETADALHHFYLNLSDEPGTFYVMHITRRDGSDEQRITIRPDYDKNPVTLASGHEIVQCVDKVGNPVDVMLPDRHERAFYPAFVNYPTIVVTG